MRPKVGLITGCDEKLTFDKGELKADFIVKKPFKLLKLSLQIDDVFSDKW